MSILVRHLAYAEAFEQTYPDDRTRIEQFFTEDAIYEGTGEDARGRTIAGSAAQSRCNP
jgi:hypothetical protein